MRTNGKKATRLCPCGYASDGRRECRCSEQRIARYLGKLSGPLLDRVDLLVEVPSLSPAELLMQDEQPTDWEAIKQRIAQCRLAQLERSDKLNSELQGGELEKFCGLTKSLRRALADTMEKLRLSARATHRIIRLARTIADYENNPEIRQQDIMEAISHRRCQQISSLGR